MATMLISYYTRTRHTEHMAKAIAEGAREAEGLQVEIRPVSQVQADDLLQYDGIILGSPVYYGNMAAEVKKLLDDSVAFHGQLSGKVGGAFASSANIGGGNETTLLALLQGLLIHGMVTQGLVMGDHYGPVAIGDVDDRSQQQCVNLGRTLGRLTTRLHG